MKKILVVTEAGDAWPSGVVRALIFKDLLRQAGYQVTYISRLSPRLTMLLENRNRFFKVVQSMFGFFLQALNAGIIAINERHIIRLAKSNDIVYLQKVGSYNIVRKLAKKPGRILVYDLNDALWLPKFAQFASGKITEILTLVDAVTCDNPQGRDFALRFNRKSYLVPDSPNFELYDQYRSLKKKDGDKIVIGWIGSPSTLYNLYLIWESLEIIFGKYKNISLRLIGSGYNNELWPPFEKVRYTTKPFYNQEELIKEVMGLDIGLFPMFNVEASVVRGILKATVYMSGGVPVVASPIGQIRELIDDGKNGMLAIDSEEWIDRLSKLIEDMKLRKTIGENGLKTIRGNFSIKSNFEKLCTVFSSTDS
jgi:glycosyltransferase involved in cell wall biosynthesis